MNLLKLASILLLFCHVYDGYGQYTPKQNDSQIIRNIYKAYNNNDTQAIFEVISPDMEWHQQTKPIKIENSQKRTILSAFFKDIDSAWELVSVEDLNVMELEKNKVLATGTLKGRYSKNEAVTTQDFKHIWWLKNGKVIKFLN
ncbi:MAG: nuclear transport factor 2 family protein [Gelidibacter sp.]